MKLPLQVAWYWLLAFKIACDELIGRVDGRDVEESRRLHREIGERVPWAVHSSEGKAG